MKKFSMILNDNQVRVLKNKYGNEANSKLTKLINSFISRIGDSHSNSIIEGFVEHECELEENSRIPASILYSMFSDYCETKHLPNCGRNTFYKHLLDIKGVWQIKVSNKLHFVGIKETEL